MLTARSGSAARRARPLQRRQPERKDVLEVGDVGAGDAVAIGGERHRLPQADGWLGGDVLVGRPTEAAGVRAADRREDGRGVGLGQGGEDALRGVRAAPAGASALGGCGERTGQQQDSEVRIAAGGGEGGVDGAADALPDREIGSRNPRCRRLGARLELRRLHVVAAGMDVHVARLQRGELGAAGGEESVARFALAQAGHVGRLWCTPTALRKSSTIASAMSTSATLCSPRQEGLLLTSSTISRPSGARIRSTPA